MVGQHGQLETKTTLQTTKICSPATQLAPIPGRCKPRTRLQTMLTIQTVKSQLLHKCPNTTIEDQSSDSTNQMLSQQTILSHLSIIVVLQFPIIPSNYNSNSFSNSHLTSKVISKSNNNRQYQKFLLKKDEINLL